jgi:hypothetical protein
MDRKLEHEHDLASLSFGVVVIQARSNRMQDLRPLIEAVAPALARLGPGKVERIRDPTSRRATVVLTCHGGARFSAHVRPTNSTSV